MYNIKSEIRAWLWMLVLILVLQALPEPLSAEEIAPSQAQGGSLLWKMAAGYSTATTINTNVDMKISGLVARVSIRQEFRNEGSEWVEGIYVFPLPDRAAVDQMAGQGGGRSNAPAHWRPLHRGRDT
jgi:Ca-activated chloride channel family protein